MIVNTNKKAQIATTLTWIVAFGLIFFIMVIFLGITFTVSAGKGLKVVDVLSSYGRNEISINGENTKSTTYSSNKEIYSIINEIVEYKGNNMRIIDLLRYYSYTGEESAFDSVNLKLKNYLDVVYEECYSFCFSYTQAGGKLTSKQISGAKCTDLNSPCIYQDSLPSGADYRLGQYVENNQNINYQIKLYTKNDGK